MPTPPSNSWASNCHSEWLTGLTWQKPGCLPSLTSITGHPWGNQHHFRASCANYWHLKASACHLQGCQPSCASTKSGGCCCLASGINGIFRGARKGHLAQTTLECGSWSSRLRFSIRINSQIATRSLFVLNLVNDWVRSHCLLAAKALIPLLYCP